MNTKTYLKGLLDRAFSTVYESSIKELYAAQVAIDGSKTAGADNQQAILFLSENLDTEGHEMLHQIEMAYQNNCQYATQYAYNCGLMCAFEQFFSNGSSKYNYEKAVLESLFTMPHMERHKIFLEGNNAALELSEKLAEQGPEGTEEMLDVLCEDWEQRVYGMAMTAFHVGYQSGLSVLESVEPFAMDTLMEKILMTEYQLGFIDPFMCQESGCTEVPSEANGGK